MGRRSKAHSVNSVTSSPIDSQFTGRSGGWRRQPAAIRGFKTTYLAAFSLDTIVRRGGGSCAIAEHMHAGYTFTFETPATSKAVE